MKIEKFIEELLDHIDDHKDAYKKWTNKQAASTWVSSHKHILSKLDLGVVIPPLTDFCRRRRLLNMSMQDVTDKTGVSKSTISRLEAGKDAFYNTILILEKFYRDNGV